MFFFFFFWENIGSAIFYYSILLERGKNYVRCFQSQHYLSRSLLVKTHIICKYRIFPSWKISCAADLVLLSSFPKETLLLIYLKVWVSLLSARKHELYKDLLKSFSHEKTRAGSKSLFIIFRAFCMVKAWNFPLSKLSKRKFQLNLGRSLCYSEE